jgi:thiol-disulfide isomerase/thioredoxin
MLAHLAVWLLGAAVYLQFPVRTEPAAFGATAPSHAMPVAEPAERPGVSMQAHTTRDTLPYDWRVRDLAGRDVALSTYRGRPIFLHLWASWCAPCVPELGAIQALRDSLDARGQEDVVFLLLAPETRSRAQSFVTRHRYALPFAVELDPLPSVLGIKAVPSTWLVDRGGRIVHVQRGAGAWSSSPFVELVSRTLQ